MTIGSSIREDLQKIAKMDKENCIYPMEKYSKECSKMMPSGVKEYSPREMEPKLEDFGGKIN